MHAESISSGIRRSLSIRSTTALSLHAVSPKNQSGTVVASRKTEAKRKNHTLQEKLKSAKMTRRGTRTMKLFGGNKKSLEEKAGLTQEADDFDSPQENISLNAP